MYTSSAFDNRKLRPNSGLTERKNCEREIESSCYFQIKINKKDNRFGCESEGTIADVKVLKKELK